MPNMVVYKVTVAGLWRAKHTQTEIITESNECRFFNLSQQPYWGLGRLIREVPRSHTDTPHSVGLLWTSDRPVSETSPWQHNTHKKQTSMPPAGFEPTVWASGRPQTQALAAGPPASANAVLIQNAVTGIYYVLMFASSCPFRVHERASLIEAVTWKKGCEILIWSWIV